MPHAEGLRGFAILLVLLFHLFPSFCRNGYVGVDMFLVLSGYFLIRGLCADTDKPFSFPRFLVKKVHRLAAPAAPVLLLTLVAGLLLFPAEELAAAVPTGLAALFGVSNIQLASLTSGYFAASTQLNPFTHTWYLGVTVQAYILFGAVAWAMCRSRGHHRLWVFLGLGLCSAIGTSHVVLKLFSPGLPPDVYYWTSARVAELAAGGLVVPLSRLRLPRHLILGLGAVALLFPLYAAFSKHHHLAQVVALVTVLLLALPSAGVVRVVLENRFMRFIGRISFSLYLVHWPIAVFARYYFGDFHGVSAVLMPLLCVALGWLCYVLTERAGGIRTIVQYGVALAAALAAYYTPAKELSLHPEADALVSRNDELLCAVSCPDYPGDVLREWGLSSWADAASVAAVPQKHRVYRLGDEKAPVSFVLIGDSHARSMAPGLDVLARELGIQGYHLSIYQTPFVDRMYANMVQRFDGKMLEALTAWLARHPEIRTVVVGQRWSLRMAGMADTKPVSLGMDMLPLRYDGSPVITTDPYADSVAALAAFCRLIRSAGKELVLMTEAPFVTDPQPDVSLRRALATGREPEKAALMCTAADYRRQCGRSLASLEELERQGLFTLVRCDRLITEQEPFLAWGEEGIRMMDHHHLSIIGSITIAQRLKEDWRAVLASPPQENTPPQQSSDQ